MKFSSISKYALFVAFIPDASSFVPNAVRFPACSTSTTPLSFTDVISVSQVARSSSELNLFGSRWRKTRQVNSQSKLDKGDASFSIEKRILGWDFNTHTMTITHIKIAYQSKST